MSDIIIEVQMVYSIHLLIRNKKLSVIIFREIQTVDKVFGFLSRILRYCSMMTQETVNILVRQSRLSSVACTHPFLYSAKFVFHNVLLSLPVCSRMFSYTISYEVRFFNIQFWGFEAELYAKHINNYILIVHS